MLKNYRYTFLFIGWMLLVTALSLFDATIDNNDGLQITYADKLVHFIFYLVGALLGSHFLREISQAKLRLPNTILMITLSMLIYGIIIEVLQELLTLARSAEWGDVVANTLGALSGAAIIWWRYSGRGPLKWKN